MGIISGLRRLLSRDSAAKAMVAVPEASSEIVEIKAGPPWVIDKAATKPRTRKGSRPAKKPLIKGKTR